MENLKSYTVENGAVGESDIFVTILARNKKDAMAEAEKHFKEKGKPIESFEGYGEAYWQKLEITSIIEVKTIPCVVESN